LDSRLFWQKDLSMADSKDLVHIVALPEEKRRRIREGVIAGLNESFPIKSRSKTLEVTDVQYQEKTFTPSEQRDAILKGDTLYENVKGTLTMRDAEGKVIDKLSNFTLARIPWLTDRHTIVVGGNEYSVSNQVRPKAGVYTRKRANGMLESNFNTRTGSNFNIIMDPVKGTPQLEYSSAKIPLYPILRAGGLSHQDVAKAWGDRLADQNQKTVGAKQDKALAALYRKMVPEYHRTEDPSVEEMSKEIFERYAKQDMDPTVNIKTIGKAHTNVTPHTLLDASKKLLNIYRNAADSDDRDSLDFKAIYGIDDFFKERIKLDARDIGRKAVLKMEATPELRKALPSGPFTGGILRFINGSTLVTAPAQTNPMDLLDSASRITAMGEGGISSERAIPMETRMVHATHIGAIDPFRTPESFLAGVDRRAARGVAKDKDNNIYVPLIDVATGKQKHVRAGELQDETVAFPHQELKGMVDALQNGQIRKVQASKVKYQMPHPSMSYSATTQLIPFIESLQGNRSVMGSKMQTQALSLTEREAPYVQVMGPQGKAVEEEYAWMTNAQTPMAGKVVRIDGEHIYIRPHNTKTSEELLEKDAAKKDPDAGLVKVPYLTNFPLAAKTHLTQTPTVKVGDEVGLKTQLTESNFTKDGRLALGKNMSVAYMPYYGANSNDAIVVSEGAAKKLTSERMYKVIIPRDLDLTLDANKHKAYYGQLYTKDQYGNLTDDGLVKPGTILKPGDPMVAALRKTTPSSDDILLGRLHKSLVKPFREQTEIWDHAHEGEVIDVVKTPKRVAITIKTREPIVIGDKLANRYGGKGVVSEIVPDAEMVKDEAGNPVDIILTSAGVVSRANPSQIIETAVGKVVEKTGKPIVVDNLTGRDNVAWAKDLLKKHNIKDKEDLFDPRSGKTIPKVFVGRQYMLKLMKTTESNFSGRGTEGGYDVNQQPVRGGEGGSKAFGKMEFDALVSHNARSVAQEAATLKGQKNDEYWRAVQLGYPTPQLKTSFAYDKLMTMLTGAGVKVNREGSTLTASPLTDEDTLKMSSGEIKEPTLIKAKNFAPETGGLFDPAVTGGLSGTNWGHIKLVEPVVSPICKEPVRRLLGMTETELDKTIAEKGGKHIQSELKKLDLVAKERNLRKSMKTKSAESLDDEVKQLKYIQALKQQGLTPDKAYTISMVPVVPPVVRPVIPGRGGQEIMYGDINPLYRDLIYTNNQFKDLKKSGLLPSEEKKLRPALQQAVGAVYGTDDPVSSKSKSRGHQGFLTYIGGTNSPKYGYFHDKILKRRQDLAGRGTIVPDNNLSMDEIGVPEDMLWDMYAPFIVKNLVATGYPALEAKEMLKKRDYAAKQVLMKELQERPLMFNRAPTLHRYSLLGAYAKPMPGKTIRISPFVESGTNADYDGDTMMLHVPASVGAVQDVKNMTMSNILYGDKNRSDLYAFPGHEAIMGVAHASNEDTKKAPKVFKTKADAAKAYNEGKIGIGTRVKIEEH
jgi:DNA-directed RNA polymerase subunit beta